MVDLKHLEPMEAISMDLGYITLSRPILVIVDQFSGYKNVWELRDSKSTSVIKAVKEFCISFGYPIQIKSDGGPCFGSKEFAKFCLDSGIYHSKSAPGHHESNGGAECGVREIKLLMKTSKAKGMELKKLVMRLNNMPSQSGDGSPNQMFFGRLIRMPGIPDLGRLSTDQAVLAEARMNNREKLREKRDEGPKPDKRQFNVGDRVRIFNEVTKDWTD